MQLADLLLAHAGAGALVLPCIAALMSAWPVGIPPSRCQTFSAIVPASNGHLQAMLQPAIEPKSGSRSVAHVALPIAPKSNGSDAYQAQSINASSLTSSLAQGSAETHAQLRHACKDAQQDDCQGPPLTNPSSCQQVRKLQCLIARSEAFRPQSPRPHSLAATWLQAVGASQWGWK